MEICRQDMLAAKALENGQHFSAGEVLIAPHANVLHLQRMGMRNRMSAVIHRASDSSDRDHQPRDACNPGEQHLPLSRRLDVRATEPPIRRCRYWHARNSSRM